MSEEEAPLYPSPDNEGGSLEAAAGDEEAPVDTEDRDDSVAALEQTVSGVEGVSLMDMEDDGSDEEFEEDNEEDDTVADEDPVSVLPGYILKRVDKLLELNSERDEIMEQYLKERAALEAKFNAMCKPLYEKRNEIIRGDHDAAIASGGVDDSTSAAEERTKDESSEGATEKAAGVPQFWVCAMGHMEAVAEIVTEEDVDCLEHLKDIECEDDPEGNGFTLRFHFAPNAYFENSVLTKQYEVPNLLLSDEPILKNVEGCEIRWKPGKSLTSREVKKRQRGKGKNAGQIRTVIKNERTESFFHFFEPPKMPSMDEMDEEEADHLEEAFDRDYDVAQAFRSHIIPKAVLWFTGKAMEEEMEQMISETDIAA